MVTAAAQIQSPAWEFPHDAETTRGKKKKKKARHKIYMKLSRKAALQRVQVAWPGDVPRSHLSCGLTGVEHGFVKTVSAKGEMCF